MFAPKPCAQRHFDLWAAQYDANVAGYDYIVPQVVAAHITPYISPHARVLDIGIGTGLCSDVMQHNHPGIHITGIDISPRMLLECKRKGITDDLQCLDIEHSTLPVPSGSYDAAISGGMLEYARNPDAVFEHVQRALKPASVFVFTFEPLETVSLYQRQLFSKIVERTDARIIIERTKITSVPPFKYMRYLHDTTHMQRLCENAGFSILKAGQFAAYHHSQEDIITYGLIVAQKV